MTIQERTKDLIVQLKRVKEREGLSNADIVRMIEENGDNISIATVGRIMAEHSEENPTFRYHDTLKPIAKALLGLDVSHLDGLTDEERGIKDVALIKEMEIREKDLKIEQLTAKIAEMEKDTERRVEYLKERIEYLKEQIENRDAAIRKKDETIERISDRLIQIVTDSWKAQGD